MTNDGLIHDRIIDKYTNTLHALCQKSHTYNPTQNSEYKTAFWVSFHIPVVLDALNEVCAQSLCVLTVLSDGLLENPATSLFLQQELGNTPVICVKDQPVSPKLLEVKLDNSCPNRDNRTLRKGLKLVKTLQWPGRSPTFAFVKLNV